MPRKSKPRAGSLQYWPRRRAKSWFATPRSWPLEEKAIPLGFAGWKAGMGQAICIDTRKGSPSQGKEVAKAITVLDCPSLLVAGIKAYIKKEGRLFDQGCIAAKKLSSEIKLGGKISANDLDQADSIRLLLASGKTGFERKRSLIFELPLGGAFDEQLQYAKKKLGNQLEAREVFDKGDWIDVVSVTKGKGFGGVVKRYGVKIRGRKDEKHHRHIGSMGSEELGRVLYSVPQPGQSGFHRRTELNKRLLAIDSELNPSGGWPHYGLIKGDAVCLSGSLPGSQKRLIFMRKAMRPPSRKNPIKIIKIDYES